MVEAARTSASPADIWVVVIVSVALFAFWLTAIMLADRSQVRASGRSRVTGETGPAHEPIGARGRHAGDESVPEGDIPTRADLPAQPTGRHALPARPAGGHALPAQRTGDADRAERSYAGPLPPDEDGR